MSRRGAYGDADVDEGEGGDEHVAVAVAFSRATAWAMAVLDVLDRRPDEERLGQAEGHHGEARDVDEEKLEPEGLQDGQGQGVRLLLVDLEPGRIVSVRCDPIRLRY